MPDARIVLGYLPEVARVLRPGGALQLHFRGGCRRKARLLRLLPARLRSPLRSTYRAFTSRHSNGRPGQSPDQSIEARYALGSLETWLGAKVPRGRVVSRLAECGIINLTVSSDPLDSSDGATYWVAGQKPIDGRLA